MSDQTAHLLTFMSLLVSLVALILTGHDPQDLYAKALIDMVEGATIASGAHLGIAHVIGSIKNESNN